jgi:hypothetical protein
MMSMRSDDYCESYLIDFDDMSRLEKMLESADGRFEIDGTNIRRYLVDYQTKATIPMFLVRILGNVYHTRFRATPGTHGILYEGGRFLSTDSTLFDKVSREAPRANKVHMMMLPGSPAQNCCLEIEWESLADQSYKGFAKVNRLFSLIGANGTQIEVWLLIYPQNDNKVLAVPSPPNLAPLIARSVDRHQIPRTTQSFFEKWIQLRRSLMLMILIDNSSWAIISSIQT